MTTTNDNKTTKEKKPSSAKATEGKKEVKVSSKLTKLIEEVEKLSVLELAELVKALEDKFGVSAAPMAAAAAPSALGTPQGAVTGAAQEAQSEFKVILAASGANKISVIKAVREIKPDLGLKEAKDLVEAAPKELLSGVKKDEAESAKKKLEAAGAQVELK